MEIYSFGARPRNAIRIRAGQDRAIYRVLLRVSVFAKPWTASSLPLLLLPLDPSPAKTLLAAHQLDSSIIDTSSDTSRGPRYKPELKPDPPKPIYLDQDFNSLAGDRIHWKKKKGKRIISEDDSSKHQIRESFRFSNKHSRQGRRIGSVELRASSWRGIEDFEDRLRPLDLYRRRCRKRDIYISMFLLSRSFKFRLKYAIIGPTIRSFCHLKCLKQFNLKIICLHRNDEISFQV